MTASNSTKVKAVNAPGFDAGRAAIPNVGLKIISPPMLIDPVEAGKFSVPLSVSKSPYSVH
jgi:hypothetical protein